MASVRDYIGEMCPACSKDILQQAPPKARMPPGDYLWCPACESQLTLADLRVTAQRAGFFRRLFGRPDRA